MCIEQQAAVGGAAFATKPCPLRSPAALALARINCYGASVYVCVCASMRKRIHQHIGVSVVRVEATGGAGSEKEEKQRRQRDGEA